MPRAKKGPAKSKAKNQKNYIGINIDVSGSMRGMEKRTVENLNNTIAEIKRKAVEAGIETMVVVRTFGSTVTVVQPLRDVSKVKSFTVEDIATGGSTALFSSVKKTIEEFEQVPDAADPNVAFLLITLTDGAENPSHGHYVNPTEITARFRELQNTDRWSFAFQLPKGYLNGFVSSFNIPAGNCVEWDQTDAGAQEAGVQSKSAIGTYYATRASGQTSTRDIFANLHVTKRDLSKLTIITGDVKVWEVKEEEQIRAFVEKKLRGAALIPGAAFYQLMKKEKQVQDYKKLALREKKSGTIFFGEQIRDFLGLPHHGTVAVEPGNFGDYDVFVQSTSHSRNLPRGTKVIYYPAAGNGAFGF